MERPAAARLAATLVVAITVARSAGEAWAGEAAPKPPAAAQVLFDEAAAALDRRDYSAACPKLEEVVRLVPDGTGAWFALAECYEGAGRLASAWSAYRRVEAAQGAQQAQRRRPAGARVEALRPRLATLTVNVPERIRALSGLEILHDGVPIEREQWGVPVPVDKGAHTLRASAPGRVPWQTTVGVVSDGVRIVVQIDSLLSAVDTDLREGHPAAAASPAPRDAAPTVAAQRIAGLAVSAFGLAATAAGAGFGTAAIVRKSQSESGPCLSDCRCTPEGIELRDEGLTFGNTSTALFVAGGALVAAGLVLLLTAPRPGAAPAARLAVGPGQVVLLGSW
jgi:hypothetical protein